MVAVAARVRRVQLREWSDGLHDQDLLDAVDSVRAGHKPATALRVAIELDVKDEYGRPDEDRVSDLLERLADEEKIARWEVFGAFGPPSQQARVRLFAYGPPA